MLSRRNFITIIAMMFTVFFMFMSISVVRNSGNKYTVNSSLKEPVGKMIKEHAWEAEPVEKETAFLHKKYVLYVGKRYPSKLYESVKQWCTYTKRNLVYHGALSEISFAVGNWPEAIVLQGNLIENSNIKELKECAEKGIPIILAGMPEQQVLESSKELQYLLGIKKIQAEKTKMTGIRLFSGFLLGGDIDYIAKDTEERKLRQDLQLDIPWYQLGAGTKTYMCGMMKDKTIKNEQLPAVIWRSTRDQTKIFVVNGDYITGDMGVGILSAMLYECEPYQIYPIINAQCYTVLNMPVLAEEHEQLLEKVYSKSQEALYRDIIWPFLVKLSDKKNRKLTCLMAPWTEKTSVVSEEKKNYIEYLKSFNEQKAEMGIHLVRGKETVEDILKKDEEWMKKLSNRYAYSAAFASLDQLTKENGDKNLAKIVQSEYLKNLRTVATEYTQDRDIVSFGNQDITIQRGTQIGTNHTFSDDIRLRSVETALGYSNVLIDLGSVIKPKSKEGRWEVFGNRLSSNLDTYWNPFMNFSSVTLTESDKKVRQLLCVNYEQSRKDNVITLQISNTEGNQAEFLLRTHEEDITKINGGSYQEIEHNVYRIQTDQETVTITVKSNAIKY